MTVFVIRVRSNGSHSSAIFNARSSVSRGCAPFLQAAAHTCVPRSALSRACPRARALVGNSVLTTRVRWSRGQMYGKMFFGRVGSVGPLVHSMILAGSLGYYLEYDHIIRTCRARAGEVGGVACALAVPVALRGAAFRLARRFNPPLSH